MNNTSINIQGNILSNEIIEKIRCEEQGYFQQPAFFGTDNSIREEIGNAWINAKALWNIFKTKKNRLKEEETGTTETRKSWMEPLLAELHFIATKAPVYLHEESGKKFEISHRDDELQGFPIHIVSYKQSLDKAPREGKLSPHALVQEYLNTVEHTYALVSNGIFLRLLRDSSRIVRISYYEFNLEKMMEEDLYSDFAILYRTLHASRFNQKNELNEGTIFEIYHLQSLESGSRLRENISVAVINGLIGYPNGLIADKHNPYNTQTGLANGFISHPANQSLREDITNERISATDFYAQLLRLIYRFLFLIVSEERGLIYPDVKDEDILYKKQIYYRFYSIERLRKLAGKSIYMDGAKDDLWESLKSTFILFENPYYGNKLGIQALASGIFAPDALRTLSTLRLDNKTLIDTIGGLCYFVNNQTGQTVRVNYSDLDVEEFGSVYEGLLEYSPSFDYVAQIPRFLFKEGSMRSNSGSHYTPEELCKPLIQHSLEHIITRCLLPAVNGKAIFLQRYTNEERTRAIQNLLRIKICDVACGSGHLLLSAARRIALEVARLITGEEQPNPIDLRKSMRQVIKHCIYGVDKNPLAVELCKVALWLEAHNPGEPLNFLDHHIKHGDSIVGLAFKEELETGIPNQAFKALPGDNKDIIQLYCKANKKQEKSFGELNLFEEKVTDALPTLISQFDSLDSMPENTPEEVESKAQAYNKLTRSLAMQRLKMLADMQVSQFFIPKTPENKNCLITNSDYFSYLRGSRIPTDLIVSLCEVSGKHNFFHWFLEFPEVFARGGFDCILGNPPFLGGQKLSGTFGNNFLEYIKYNYKPIGAVDLVTYFFRRIFNILRPDGFLSLVSTNTIAQGAAREGGLDVICNNGGVINHAVRSMRWPGAAAVEVSLVTIRKGEWNHDFILDRKKVERITPYLDDAEVIGNPYPLKQNVGKSFQGSIVLGKGFVLEPDQAAALIAKDPRNKEVLFPYLNGEDLNNDPQQKPSRWVINFFDWSEEKARTYPDCFEIVERLVKPERMKLDESKSNTNKQRKKNWWRYGSDAKSLYETISKVDQVMVISEVTKYVDFTFVPTNIVYMHTLKIITFSDFVHLCILSSSLHKEWAWKYSSTMGGGTLRFTPSSCFETFPFLNCSNHLQRLSELGKDYYYLKTKIMKKVQIGITKLFNLFNDKEFTSIDEEKKEIDDLSFVKAYGKNALSLKRQLSGANWITAYNEIYYMIVRLRILQQEVDNEVLAFYNWHDIELKHEFYEHSYLPKKDNVRFTIHPDARKEILKRLLILNHKIKSNEIN